MPVAPAPRWNARRNRWYVKLRGKQYILAYGRKNKRQAREKFNRLRAEVYAVDPPGEPRTVRQLVERFLKLYPSVKNRTLLKDWMFWQHGRLGEIDRDCLIHYATYLQQKGNGEWTVKAKIGIVTRVLRWAVQHEYLSVQPIKPKLATPPKGHRDIGRSKVAEVLDGMNAPRRRRTGTIVKFSLACGCRPGEARKLCWRHIDLDAREVRLSHREHKTGKETGRDRVIYLNDDALIALNDAGGRDGRRGFVFRNNAGLPFPRGGVYQNLRRWFGITPNQLRHEFAQNALGQVGIEDVAVLLGHESTRMTSIYAEVRAPRAHKVARSISSPLARSDQSSVPALAHLQAPPETDRGESANAHAI